MDNSTQIDVFFRYTVKDDSRFNDYLDAVLPITERDEPYVLEYNLARDADGVVLQHERYENEAAVLRHLKVTAEGQKAWQESTDLIDVRFVGQLSDEFKGSFSMPIATWWDRFRAVAR